MIVNLGCGSQVVEGWVNVDYALGARVARNPVLRFVSERLGLFRFHWDQRIHIHDLRKPFPWPDASVDAVYTSHTLEHLTKEEGRRFLRECHRVLRHQGVIRIIVPDLARFVSKYLKGSIAADDFVEALGVLYPIDGGVLRRKLAALIYFPHKCMYDEKRLAEILTETGFEGVARRQGLESAIPNVAATGETATQVSLTMEGQKK